MKKSMVSYILGSAALLTLLIGLLRPAAAQPLDPAIATAYEVIQFQAHENIVRQISFDSASSVSGIAALKLTGLDVQTKNDSSFGEYVCSIEGVGDCSGVAPYYWAYYRWNPATLAWDSSNAGASSTTVLDGALEGWAYLSFSFMGDPALPAAPRVQAVHAAMAWLRSQQSPTDGGYGDLSASVEALLAVGSNGYRAAAWGSPSLGRFWLANGTNYAQLGAASSGKLALGLQLSNACWLANAAHPADFYNPATGFYQDKNGGATGAGPQSWAILGALALGDPVPPLAVTALKDLALAGGGWEWQPPFGADSNTTALAIQALLAAGEAPDAAGITAALAFLKTLQQSDGGMGYDGSIYTTSGDADSTAYAIMAIQAAGQDPSSAAWSQNGESLVSFLLGLQLPSGAFEWQKGFGQSGVATTHAIAALLGNDYLPRGSALTQCPVVYIPLLER